MLTATLSYPTAGTAVCSAVGEVDLATAPLLLEQLRKAVDREPRYLVVDLSAVTFFAAAGVGVLAAAADEHRGAHELILAGPAPAVLRVLDVCELTIRRFDDLDRALAACDRTAAP